MALKVKVGFIGAFDMLKFKNMAATREKAIQAAPANEIVSSYKINDNAKALHPDFLRLKVAEIIDHPGSHAKSFFFESEDGGALPLFRAGQYISLKLKIGDSFVTRPYSISSSPGWALEGKYAITVESNPAGFAADYLLNNLKVGDRVVTSAPLGDFYYESLRDQKKVVALTGGSGITPFLSMAYAIRDGFEDFDLTIIYGNRTVSSILFKDELDAIQKSCDKVKVIHVISDEEAEGFEKGFITADIIKKYAPEEYSIFICGPGAMYDFVGKEIAGLGLPKRLVRSEAKAVTKTVWEEKGYPQDRKDKVFKITVRQGAKERVIDASANENILVALERAGIKAPSRCRSGECGFCRSKLISGECFFPEANEGRRYADRQHGYIHPCSTFPVSDLVLEVPGEYLPKDM